MAPGPLSLGPEQSWLLSPRKSILVPDDISWRSIASRGHDATKQMALVTVVMDHG